MEPNERSRSSSPYGMSPPGATAGAEDRTAGFVAVGDSFEERGASKLCVASLPRPSVGPGMGFSHDVLLAVIMAVAMTATVFLYR